MENFNYLYRVEGLTGYSAAATADFNRLMRKHLNHRSMALFNVVYTINEPAAAGAYEALRALGREGEVLIVSVDGGCPGVQNIKDGVIGATSQQYPLRMASLGIEAIANFAETGEKPAATEGKNFFDTGVALVTDDPVEGVPSIDTDEGMALCWG